MPISEFGIKISISIILAIIAFAFYMYGKEKERQILDIQSNPFDSIKIPIKKPENPVEGQVYISTEYNINRLMIFDGENWCEVQTENNLEDIGDHEFQSFISQLYLWIETLTEKMAVPDYFIVNPKYQYNVVKSSSQNVLFKQEQGKFYFEDFQIIFSNETDFIKPIYIL